MTDKEIWKRIEQENVRVLELQIKHDNVLRILNALVPFLSKEGLDYLKRVLDEGTLD